MTLDLLKSCKDGAESSHNPLPKFVSPGKFPLMLLPYIILVHLSKLRNQQ